MARKEKAVYAPGELSKIRENLGIRDDQEAKRMARLLGGEVGYERTREQESARKAPSRRVRHETVELVVGNRGSSSKFLPKRRVETAEFDGQGEATEATETAVSQKARHKGDPADDPSVPLNTSYFERVKMDRFASQSEFDIKSPSQALFSVLSIFSEPPDYVNPLFVNRRFNDYYKRLELLVTSTRTLLPRNNTRRSERLKKVSPFSFLVLDTIRYWNIERITSDLAKIQSHPRTARVTEFADILRAVYKPLFVMEYLDTDTHIKGAFKVLYKILYLENPIEPRDKYQRLIRNALSAFVNIRRDLRYLLYPLLMKLISDRWLPYDRFFVERRRRFMAFINVTEADRILPGEAADRQMKDGKESAKSQNDAEEQSAEDQPEEDPDDPEVIERKARQSAQDAERKALDKGLTALETLFPKAGWDRLATYPDFYPYFTDMFGLKKGYELIAPTDPLQQVAILMHILKEFFFGIRYITFGVVPGSDGDPIRVEDYLGSVINNWQRYIDVSFEKDYLPRLVEYCQILENTADSRTSPYAKRILNELHWAKRLYFLPYYKYESIGPPPFRKGDITPLYAEIRLLRKYLTAVAAGIEQGKQQGGAAKMAPCDGIDNPWEIYNFEVPNPVSVRLDALLGPAQRNNASLVFFTLAVATVLDHLVNDESSWAYETRSGPLFRSVNGEGIMPLFGVETKIDAEVIFRQMIRQRDKRT